MPKLEKLAQMPAIEGGCRYFDGMYDGRLVYRLDHETGLRETEG